MWRYDIYGLLIAYIGTFADYEFTIRAGKRGVKLETCSEIYLMENRSETGLRFLDVSGYSSLRAFFASMFSKRSIPNPLYRIVFILMTCPPRYILGNILEMKRGVLQ